MKLTKWGEYSRDERCHFGITLRDHAKFLGISSAKLSAIETGRSDDLTTMMIANTCYLFAVLQFGWVNVNDRLPLRTGLVLVKRKNGVIDTEYFIEKWNAFGGQCVLESGVSHWAVLPSHIEDINAKALQKDDDEREDMRRLRNVFQGLANE